jgi:carbon-monoxide dehydrogenase medium subunit
MKPAPFVYHNAGSLPEALELMATLDGCRVIAGGQSLMPMLNLRAATVDHLVDLGEIDELVGARVEGGSVFIGAMTTQRSLLRSQLIARYCPLMVEALSHVGHQQTRNRGTIGGSLCHLDPAAELPIVAMATDATVRIASLRGDREIPFAEFPAGILSSTLETDEILTQITIPKDTSRGFAFEEIARRPGDFAIVAIAVLMGLEGQAVENCAIAVGGLSAGPMRITEIETLLNKRPLNDGAIAQAQSILRSLPVESDLHNSAAYKRHVAGALLQRALEAAHRRVEVRRD